MPFSKKKKALELEGETNGQPAAVQKDPLTYKRHFFYHDDDNKNARIHSLYLTFIFPMMSLISDSK